MIYPIKIVIEETKTGFSAFIDEYPIATTGKDLKELLDNIQEAINLFEDAN